MKFIRNALFKVAGLTTAALLAVGVSSAYAQEMSEGEQSIYEEDTWNFGAKGGVTLSYFGNNLERLGNETQKGLAIGGYAQYNYKTWLSFRGELWYMQTGAANMPNQHELGVISRRDLVRLDGAGYTIEGSATSSNFYLHNIEVPLQVVVRPPFLRKFYPSFYAGYSIAFNFYATDERTETIYYTSPSPLNRSGSLTNVALRNVGSDFRVIDQGANMGFGLTYPIPEREWNIVLDFRYRMGLSQLGEAERLNSVNGEPVTEVTDLSSNTIFMTVGIEF